MKGLLTLLVLAAISAGVFALGTLRQPDTGKSLLNIAEEVALTVSVSTPEQGEILRHVQAPGDVEAVLEVEISSEIVAKIVEMPVEEGDTVKAGDLLCRLDDRDLRAEMESPNARIAQLEASKVQAEADVEKAEYDFDWQVGLSESDASSNMELRNAHTAKKKADAMLEMRRQELVQAAAALKRLQERIRKTVITAPIDGVISKLNAKQGEVVITGTMNNPGTVIMSISDLSRMQVRARIDEVDVPLVQQDQKARVYLQSDPNVPLPARVVRVASKGIKAQGRDIVTFEALLEVLSDDARIKPAMTANVEIEVARRDDAVKIPVEAVVHRMRKDLPESIVAAFDKRQVALDISDRVRKGQYIKVVYVKQDEVAKVRLIEPGIADTQQVEIREGIDIADVVIVGPYRSLDQLKDGKKVQLSEADKKKNADEANADDNEKVAENEADKADETGEADPDAADRSEVATASTSP